MKRNTKTQEEINIMILALEKQKAALPQFNFFGGNNHLLYDTQISILKGEIDNEDEIWNNEDEYGDAMSDIACAFDWLKGDSDDENIVDDEHLIAAKAEYSLVSTLNVCAKQCNECPFSKKSMKGWLADYSVNDIEDYHKHEALFPCHKMMKDGDMDQFAVQVAIQEGKLKLCRGYVESIIKSGKMPYKNKTLVEAYKKVKELGVGENSMNVMEFREHHTKLIKK